MACKSSDPAPEFIGCTLKGIGEFLGGVGRTVGASAERVIQRPSEASMDDWATVALTCMILIVLAFNSRSR